MLYFEQNTHNPSEIYNILDKCAHLCNQDDQMYEYMNLSSGLIE